MLTLELIENGGACSQQCPQSKSFILTKFEQQIFFKAIKKQKNKETNNLGP
jgi:hypothetical protein